MDASEGQVPLFWIKLGQMVRVTQKMTLTYNGADPQSRNGETDVFASGPKSQNGPKIHFLPKKNFNKLNDHIFLGGKQYFLVFTTIHADGKCGNFSQVCEKILIFGSVITYSVEFSQIRPNSDISGALGPIHYIIH